MTGTTTRTDDETRTNRGWTALGRCWSALDRGWKAAVLGLALVALQFTPVVPL